MKAVKGFDLEEAQRHVDNLFDVRVFLAGGKGLFSPYVTAETQKLVEFCTEAMEFLLTIKGFGDEVTRSLHSH